MTDGFPPIVGERPLLLILGTGPSLVSLEKQEYYGHPTNAFWPIMGELFHTQLSTYQQKQQLLIDHQIALWDTLKCFDRVGSLDSGYKKVEPNDIKAFLLQHPTVGAVCFTGKKAQEFYQRYVAYYPEKVTFTALPSPSAANTTPKSTKMQTYRTIIGNTITLN